MQLAFFIFCAVVLVLTDIISGNSETKKMFAYLPGDFVLGALFSIHHQPSQKLTDRKSFLVCGEIRELYGIQRAEVAFKTIDEINAIETLLPNITLGIEIRDSCWYAPIALQQTIEMIRDTISPKQMTNDKCSPIDSKRTTAMRKPLIGIIGPGSSSVALQVQNLLQLFAIPQIGYSTTSKDLSDKARYTTLLRVVPSDYFQAQVMVDIVKRFNWTYVSAVNTDENYGQSGIQAFRELAERNGVCIAKEDSILSNAPDEAFTDVLKNLQSDANARVVVCFCEGMTVRGLLAAMQRLNLSNHFLIIGSDGWADRADVVTEFEREAVGSISIRIHSSYVTSFDPYYFKLRPSTNHRNPWFKEFWQTKFNCTLSENRTTGNLCTGHETLSIKYKQEPKLSFVVRAIYTMAYALHAMQIDICEKPSHGPCPAMFPFNKTLFLSYLMNVSFLYGPDSEHVEFDKSGDPPGRYDVMNFQKIADETYDYVQVAIWNNGTLKFNKDLQTFGKTVESICSRPCRQGYYKHLQTGGQEKACCWSCVACEQHQFLLNETDCADCPLGHWPVVDKTHCIRTPVEYLRWSDTEALVSIGFALFGLTCTAIVLFFFVRFNSTPVAKAATRELCYIILVAMSISHASIFCLIIKPSQWSCTCSRTIPGISFSAIYGSIFVKTHRIARILIGSKKRFPSRNLRFMSSGAQILIVIILIVIETSIAIGAIVYLDPAKAIIQHPVRNKSVLLCVTTPKGLLMPLAFVFVLFVLCTIYALKTRNVPENFNEAKFIGFAMYTTCVIWIAFVPIYFGSEAKIITMSICISLSSTVTLMFLFFPKIFIMMWRPQKNVRAMFTTAIDIRCHIGSHVAAAIVEKSSYHSSGQCTSSELSRGPSTRSFACQTPRVDGPVVSAFRMVGAPFCSAHIQHTDHTSQQNVHRILSNVVRIRKRIHCRRCVMGIVYKKYKLTNRKRPAKQSVNSRSTHLSATVYANGYDQDEKRYSPVSRHVATIEETNLSADEDGQQCDYQLKTITIRFG